MQVCTSSQTATPTSHHSVFYRPDALPATQPTASKHWTPMSKTYKANSRHISNCFTEVIQPYQKDANSKGSLVEKYYNAKHPTKNTSHVKVHFWLNTLHNDTTIVSWPFEQWLPGWASTWRNMHPLTPILIINHPLSASSIYYDGHSILRV